MPISLAAGEEGLEEVEAVMKVPNPLLNQPRPGKPPVPSDLTVFPTLYT